MKQLDLFNSVPSVEAGVDGCTKVDVAVTVHHHNHKPYVARSFCQAITGEEQTIIKTLLAIKNFETKGIKFNDMFLIVDEAIGFSIKHQIGIGHLTFKGAFEHLNSWIDELIEWYVEVYFFEQPHLQNKLK